VRLLKIIFSVLVVIVAFSAGAMFYSANAQLVKLDLFFGDLVESPLGFAVLVTLLIGFTLGVVMTAIPLLASNMSRRRAKRSLASAKKEIQELRMAPIKNTDVD